MNTKTEKRIKIILFTLAVITFMLPLLLEWE